MTFTWLVLFVVIGLSGAWWWQDRKAQQEEITTMADQSSAELSSNSEQGQSVSIKYVDNYRPGYNVHAASVCGYYRNQHANTCRNCASTSC